MDEWREQNSEIFVKSCVVRDNLWPTIKWSDRFIGKLKGVCSGMKSTVCLVIDHASCFIRLAKRVRLAELPQGTQRITHILLICREIPALVGGEILISQVPKLLLPSIEFLLFLFGSILQREDLKISNTNYVLQRTNN